MSSDVMCNSKKQSTLNSDIFYSSHINQHCNNDSKRANNNMLFEVRPTIPTSQSLQEVASYRSASYSNLKGERFKFDVLLIYDLEQDYYSAQDLVSKLQPQQLKIFDFAMECPPGKSQRQFFAEALNYCKYTCLVVTRNFINNFWLKFKADMAIQDMLQNEDKSYSLIVIVMDAAIKINDIPLELQTLSPIFSSGRFFEHRLTKAFAGNPFTQSSNPPSFQQTNPSMNPPQSFHFHDSLSPRSGQSGRSQENDNSSRSSENNDSDNHPSQQYGGPSIPHKISSNSPILNQRLSHQPQELNEQCTSRNPPQYNTVFHSPSGSPHSSSMNTTSYFNSTSGPSYLSSVNPTCGPSYLNSMNPTYQQFQSNSTFDKSSFNLSSQTYTPSNLSSMYPTCGPPAYEPGSSNSTCTPSSGHFDASFSRSMPQEHSHCSQSSYQCDQQKALEEYSTKFQRMTSVTQSSNGCRIPTESDDSIMTSSLPGLQEKTEIIEKHIDSSIETQESELSQSSEFVTIENIYDSPTTSSDASIAPPVGSLDNIELEISVDDISLKSHPSLKNYSEKIRSEKRNTSMPDLQVPDTSIDSRHFKSFKRSFSKLKKKFHS